MKPDKRMLVVEFIHDNCPRWILHPEFVQILGLKKIILQEANSYFRGQASMSGGLWISEETAKWRHASPYTQPKGKSDLSPLGVFAHEMGHHVWFAIRRKYRMSPRSKKLPPVLLLEWHILHANKKKGGITSYARSHPEEDFAETHRLFVLNPRLLKQLCPDRYKMMCKCYIELIGTDKPKSKFKQGKGEFAKQWEVLTS